MAQLYSLHVFFKKKFYSTQFSVRFIGIFDEEHVRDGLRTYIKENIPVISGILHVLSEEQVINQIIDRILSNDGYLHVESGEVYYFVVNRSECNVLCDG